MAGLIRGGQKVQIYTVVAIAAVISRMMIRVLSRIAERNRIRLALPTPAKKSCIFVALISCAIVVGIIIVGIIVAQCKP